MAVCRASARRVRPFLSSTVGPKPPPPPKSPIRASSVSLRVSAGFRLAGLLGRSLAELACFHTRSGVDPVHSTLGKDPAHSTQAALASRCCTGAPSWAYYTLVTLARTTSAYVRRTGFASREERGVIPHTTVRAVRQDAAQSYSPAPRVPSLSRCSSSSFPSLSHLLPLPSALCPQLHGYVTIHKIGGAGGAPLSTYNSHAFFSLPPPRFSFSPATAHAGRPATHIASPLRADRPGQHCKQGSRQRGRRAPPPRPAM